MNRTTPIRRSFTRGVALLTLLAVLAAACSDDTGADVEDDNAPDLPETTEAVVTTAPSTTAAIPDDGEALIDLQINVVEFGAEGFIEIVNHGDSDADLNGVWLCQRPAYVDIGTLVDGTLAPGATVQVPVASWTSLDAASGEAALYQGDSFGSADAILSYVAWGEVRDGRASVAVEAGIWPSSDDAVTPDPAFNSIESGGDPADPENWS